jgi:hypothetical protein
MISAVFDGVEKSDADIEFTVKVSMIEIYMERIRDLLDRAFPHNLGLARVGFNV